MEGDGHGIGIGIGILSDGDGDPYCCHGILCPLPGRRFCSGSRGEQSPHSEEEERKHEGED